MFWRPSSQSAATDRRPCCDWCWKCTCSPHMMAESAETNREAGGDSLRASDGSELSFSPLRLLLAGGLELVERGQCDHRPRDLPVYGIPHSLNCSRNPVWLPGDGVSAQAVVVLWRCHAVQAVAEGCRPVPSQGRRGADCDSEPDRSRTADRGQACTTRHIPIRSFWATAGTMGARDIGSALLHADQPLAGPNPVHGSCASGCVSRGPLETALDFGRCSTRAWGSAAFLHSPQVLDEY